MNVVSYFTPAILVDAPFSMQQPSSQSKPQDDDLWRRAHDLLERSEHLPPPARLAFIESEAQDSALRNMIAELLASEEEELADNLEPTGETPHPGIQIGRYEVLEPLGSGGTGQVFRALDVELGRVVALKFLSRELASSARNLDVLLREARAASALNHPNIVTIFELVRSPGKAAIAMELLPGSSLRALCGKPLAIPRLLSYAHQIASALTESHCKGIIHRDIKPENVVLADTDRVKVVDFGMAGQLAPGDSSSYDHLGTLQYFSPEQARGERAVAASDIFSLGVVLYELATGRHPFEQEGALTTLHAIVMLPPHPLRGTTNLPASLHRLLLAMLSKQPEQRPTAGQVLAELTRMIGQKENATRRWVAAAVAIATVLIAIGVFVWVGKLAGDAIVLEQLTSTDTENRVTAAAISPDGSQFAYADIDGAIFLRSIDDKRTRLLRQEDPELVEHISWFPNQSSLLLVTRRFTANHASAWILPLSASSPQLVQSGIGNASLSPDGSRLAITNSDLREIWLADLKSGLGPQLIASAGEAETFPVVGWAANGKHLLCQRRSQLTRPVDPDNKAFVAPVFQQVYESIDAATGQVVFKQQDVGIRSSAVRSDGRMLFLNTETTDFSTNLFEMDTDPESGRIQTPPHPLTTYKEMALAGLSASNDGHRMIAVHYEFQPDVYVAEIDPDSKHIKESRRLTIDRAHDYPHSFSVDGQTVFFESTRHGTFDIFRQPLGQRHAEFLAGQPDRDEFNPIATPDGKWVLYGTHGKKGEGRTLERVSVNGGKPESVPIGGPLDYFDCALAGGKGCVLRTVENKLHVFYELDPIAGKGRELARVRWSPGAMGDWSLSPDGTEVAMPNHDMAERLIRVVPLDPPGQFGHVVRLASGPGMINGIHYAADGTGWFVVLREADDYFRSAPLLKVKLCFVNRRGVITNLHDVPITTWATVSPGGKRIAFPDGVISGNVVLLRRQ